MSGNGRTMMPAWFVRTFGLAFLGGAAWTTLTGGMPWPLAAEVTLVGLAMVFVAARR